MRLDHLLSKEHSQPQVAQNTQNITERVMLSAHGWNKRQASLIPRLCEYIGPVMAGLVGKDGCGVGFALSAYYWVLKDQPAAGDRRPLVGWGFRVVD